MEANPALFILYIIVILIAAKVFGEIAERIGQPPVLGELIAGVVIGNSLLRWVYIPAHGDVTLEAAAIEFLAELGAILLLFEIGLESDLEEFLRVGPSALVVALIGIAAPFAAGYFVAIALGLTGNVPLFLGATLTATSVGITARTLSDMGKLRTPEAQTVLGAAVIDDVVGLIILAVISGLVATGAVSVLDIGRTSILAILFLIGAVVVGIPLAPYMLKIVKRLHTRGMLTISAVLFCLTLAYFAHSLHLATIVGAFAAGLVLARTEDLAHIQERVKPVADIFIPIFFVVLGIKVDISVLNPANPDARSTFVLILVLTAVAVITKVISGAGVLKRGMNRLAIGVGMIPRGEVGFIFASIGLAGGLITAAEYAAIIAVIILTTFMTPPLLKVVFSRGTKKPPVDAVPPTGS